MVRKGVTVWPGGRLPLPTVSRIPDCYLWEGQTGLWIRGDEGGTPLGFVDSTVEPDLYLRDVRDLDVEDPEKVWAFFRDYGVMDQADWHAENDITGVHLLHPDAIQSSRSDADRYEVESADLDSLGLMASPRQIGHQLALVRDLTSLSLAITGRMSWEEAHASLHPMLVNSEGIIEGLEDVEEMKVEGEDIEVQETYLTEALLGFCLRDFHVAVNFSPVPNPWRWSAVQLDAVLCLSLANDLADDADFKRCASETCGRFFTRHRGRATQGKYHMTGVKYCSVECARAQKQREYRRRQRQKGAKP